MSRDRARAGAGHFDAALPVHDDAVGRHFAGRLTAADLAALAKIGRSIR